MSYSVAASNSGGSRFPSQLSLSSTVSTQLSFAEAVRRQLRGRLKPALGRLCREKVLKEQPGLVYALADDAQEFLENYAIEKLAALCEPHPPSGPMEAEERLLAVFAGCNIEADTMREIQELASRKKKKAAVALYDLIHKALPRFDEIVCLLIVLVFEHVLKDIFKVAFTYMNKIKIQEIQKVDIKIVVNTFFCSTTSSQQQQCEPDYMWYLPDQQRQCVNELLYFEETFTKQLKIIEYMFRQPLVELNPASPDIDTIFSGALHAVSECATLLFVALDDSRNITERPMIGHCFYEISEEGHFEIFGKYAQEVLNTRCQDRLLSLLSNRSVQDKYELFGRYLELRCLSRLTTAHTTHYPQPASQHQQHFLFSSIDPSNPTQLQQQPSVTSIASELQQQQQQLGDVPEETRNCMLNACRYLLPKLLLVPIGHFLHYDRILEHFEQFQPSDSDSVDSSDDDIYAIKQCRSILLATRHRIETALEAAPASPDFVAAGGRPLSPLASRLFFHTAMRAPDANHPDQLCARKLEQLKLLTKSGEIDARPKCALFYREGTLYQMERGGRFHDRRVWLFNTKMFVLKAANKALALRGSGDEYKLKRVVYLMQHSFFIVDHSKPSAGLSRSPPNSGADDEMHTFAIEYLVPPEATEGNVSQPNRQRVVFGTRSLAEKEEWMLLLVYLQCYHMFEEYLFNSRAGSGEDLEDLCFPVNFKGYEFFQPDSEQVLELEENMENSSSDSHVIRRATVNKLIEKMTHGSGNMDCRLMRVFLMTYRSFCTPQRFMTKLISRFSFPEFVYADFQTRPDTPTDQAQARKRIFEATYCRKVRLRVLKVMSAWIEGYYQDFEKEPELAETLRCFLTGPLVDRLVEFKKFQVGHLLRQLDRRSCCEEPPAAELSTDYPEVLWHTAREPKDFNLMTLHPLELARQITLYMFSLYRRIQPWELVTGDWMKTNDKAAKAPNVHALIRYTNRLTWWCCCMVLTTQNLEERRYVLLRIYELMKHFRDLNNFLGLAALDSVFVNSSVQYIRLQHSWKLIKNGKNNKFLLQSQELVSNGNYLRQYEELLRSLDGACVPNLRYHLTMIFRILEINKARHREPESAGAVTEAEEADATVMVPFFCYRQVAERVEELLRAKDTCYQLREELSILGFVRSLDPMGDLQLMEVDDTSKNQLMLDDKFYEMSYELEPKDLDEDTLKRRNTERRFPPDCLRSPASGRSGKPAGTASAVAAAAAAVVGLGGGVAQGSGGRKSTGGAGGLTVAGGSGSYCRPTSPMHSHQHQHYQQHHQQCQHQQARSTGSAGTSATAAPSPDGSASHSPSEYS